MPEETGTATPPENPNPPEVTPPAPKLSAENQAIEKAKNKPKASARLDEKDDSPEVPPAEPHLHMEIEDPEIMAMDIRLVCQDLTLVNRGQEEFHRQFMTLCKRKNDIEKKLTDIGRRSATLGKVQLILERTQKKGPSDAIKAFQQRSKEQRALKAKNAQEFLKHGTTPEAIKKMINPKSPIDQGFAGRKPPHGAGRPGQRLPARI